MKRLGNNNSGSLASFKEHGSRIATLSNEERARVSELLPRAAESAAVLDQNAESSSSPMVIDSDSEYGASEAPVADTRSEKVCTLLSIRPDMNGSWFLTSFRQFYHERPKDAQESRSSTKMYRTNVRRVMSRQNRSKDLAKLLAKKSSNARRNANLVQAICGTSNRAPWRRLTSMSMTKRWWKKSDPMTQARQP
jgi:hypothetical protein